VRARNGVEVVAAASEGVFDLILMDVQMPELDGLEATMTIRAREAGTDNHIPIIALTANVMKGDELLCTRAGMDDYLAKPIDPSALRAALARWGTVVVSRTE
jgi:two-component system, sensor histidine kinase and response regulator